MPAPVTVVDAGGLPVVEADNGLPLTPAENAVPVTIVAAGGVPVQFIGVDGTAWPGGEEP